MLVTAALAVAVYLTRTADVEVGLPPGADDDACAAAGARWPAEVAGEAARPTAPEHRAVRAWGNPAVIARCGVPPLGPTTEQCISVDGIDWVASRLDDGVRLTTFGTTPAIELLVPQDYAPAPLLLPGFAEAAGELPPNGRRCS